MFKKNEDAEQEPRTAPKERSAPGYTSSIEVRTRNVSVIGPTLIFKGELSANEDLVIEGQIEGKIAHQDKNLTVGKQGRVAADIHAQNVEVHGEVAGDIYGSKLVKLSATAVVTGNIECARIIMEDGACFAGNIKMDRRPKSDAPPKLKVADDKGAETKVEQGAA